MDTKDMVKKKKVRDEPLPDDIYDNEKEEMGC